MHNVVLFMFTSFLFIIDQNHCNCCVAFALLCIIKSVESFLRIMSVFALLLFLLLSALDLARSLSAGEVSGLGQEFFGDW